MSLIDNTYFVGDIALPNLGEVPNTFQDTMDRYEEESLKSLLGYQLYNAFIAGIAEETPDQKWLDLRDGVEFTFDFCGETITQKWNGLINAEKVSLISYYVYYQYRYENISTTTSINDVQGMPENATKVNDTRKMVYAWDKGLNLYGEIASWFFFSKYSNTYEFYTDEPSAYNFLNANRADYDNWVFTPLLRLNEFGI
jgi:hypothetical protein